MEFEGLVRNRGQMRLIVGCKLEQGEIDAIERGLSVREAVDQRLRAIPLVAEDNEVKHALELLAWMVARGYLDVKVAVPCDLQRRVIVEPGMFHEKVGIIEDKTGDRLSFSGGINETPTGWTRNWDSFHVFTSWEGGAKHLDEDEDDFARLWSKMGIPFTHVDTSDSVEGWKARDIPSLGDIRSLGLITLGRFRSSTRGLAAKRRAVSISGGFAGRMALSAPTARPWASRGECRAACCAVEPAIGRYR